MLNLRPFSRLAGILTAALFMTFAPAHAQEATTATPPPKVDLLDFLDTDHVIGNPDSPVRLIEYASLSCSHCMQFATQDFPELKKQYIDTNKIAFVYRHFPLNEPAMRGAILAECSGDNFYNYVKVMFDSQPEWAYDLDFLQSLHTLAKVGGLGEEAFDKCLADKEMEARIVTGMKMASAQLGVSGTPSIFLNGNRVDDHSFDNLSKLIDAELQKAGK